MNSDTLSSTLSSTKGKLAFQHGFSDPFDDSFDDSGRPESSTACANSLLIEWRHVLERDFGSFGEERRKEGDCVTLAEPLARQSQAHRPWLR